MTGWTRGCYGHDALGSGGQAGRPVAPAQGSWEAHPDQGPLRTSPPGGEASVVPGQRPSQAPGTQPQEGATLTARVVGLRVPE